MCSLSPPPPSPPHTMLGAHLRQHRLALDQRASRLHQVVYDDDVPPGGAALFEAHNTLVTVAHLVGGREGEDLLRWDAKIFYSFIPPSQIFSQNHLRQVVTLPLPKFLYAWSGTRASSFPPISPSPAARAHTFVQMTSGYPSALNEVWKRLWAPSSGYAIVTCILRPRP